MGKTEDKYEIINPFEDEGKYAIINPFEEEKYNIVNPFEEDISDVKTTKNDNVKNKIELPKQEIQTTPKYPLHELWTTPNKIPQDTIQLMFDPISGYTGANLNKYIASQGMPVSGYTLTDSGEVVAQKGALPDKSNPSDITKAAISGFTTSTGSLMLKKEPYFYEPKNVLEAAIQGFVQVLGDTPTNVVGGLIGGGAAGAFALSSGVRKVYLDMLENGKIKTGKEFVARGIDAITEAAKGYATGKAVDLSGVIGSKVGRKIFNKKGIPYNAREWGKEGVKFASELMGLSGSSALIEQHMPTKEDFATSALILAGFKGQKKVSNILKKIYIETGTTPSKIVEEVKPITRVAKIDEYLTRRYLLKQEVNPQEATELISEELPISNKNNISTETLNSGVFGPIYEGVTKLLGNKGNAIKRIFEFFDLERTVPDSEKWMYARQAAKGRMALGEALAKSFIKKHENLGENERYTLWKFLNGDITIEGVPQELKKTAIELRRVDNLLGKTLVDYGIISDKTYEENKGKHVKYIYDIFMVNRDNDVSSRSSFGGPKINEKFFAQRKDVPEGIREEWGLMRDPILATARSMMEVYHTTAMKDYMGKLGASPKIIKTLTGEYDVIGINGKPIGTFNSFKDAKAAQEEGALQNKWIFNPSVVTLPDGRRLGIGSVEERIKTLEQVEKELGLNPEQETLLRNLKTAREEAISKAGRIPSDYVKIEGSAFGDLNGAYLHKTIANDLMPYKDIHISKTPVGKFLYTLTGLWKMKNVAYNPPTIFRNVYSNIMQLNISGMNLAEIGLYFKKAVSSMSNKDQDYYNALKQGLFQGNFSVAELGELMSIGNGLDFSSLGGIVRGAEQLGKYYGKIDDVFKLTKFLSMKNKGFSNEEAARQANKWGMDYSLVHPLIRKIRMSPLGSPYITYQYKVLPLLLEGAMQHPIAMAKWVALPKLIQSALMDDLSDEEIEDYLEKLPSYIRGGQITILPGKYQANALDFSYLTPWGNWWQSVNLALQGDISEASRQMGTMSAPQVSILYGVVTNKNLFTGEPIINPLSKGNPREIAKDLSNFIWDFSVPPFASSYGAAGKIYEHLKYGQTKKGLKTEWFNAFPRMIGLNIYPVDPQAKAKFQSWQAREVSKALSKRLQDQNMSEEEKKLIMELSQQRIYDIFDLEREEE